MSIFVPLHIISGYSFLQSGLTMERIKKAIIDNDFYGAGLADISVMHGLPLFIKTMEGINKPFIIGMTEVVANDNLTFYAINEDGYKNLIKLNSIENINGELTLDDLKNHANGLISVIETKYGEFKNKFLEDEKFAKYLLEYAKIFKDNFYLGIEVTSKEDIEYANKVRKFAEEHLYECVAFPRIKYLKKDDAIVLAIVNAINDDKTLDIKKLSGLECFLTEGEYQKIYTKKEIVNTVNIVNKSTFSYHQKRGEVIHVDVNDAKEELKNLCYIKLNELKLNDNQKYVERLEHELDVIISMGYADYFLLVRDYVSWAKNNDILVGPGRGSAAGSLVSYLLNITEVDPLLFNLQFERFLNPHRKTMPDIDVDFMDIRRNDVVQYMRDKYGKDRVANIVTFQTILAKQALRDVGKAYNVPERHISLLCKLLTNKDYDLRTAYKKLPEFKKLVDSDQFYLEIVSLASKIEGLPRQSGTHAAGIILNNSPLDESIPVTIDFTGNYITQYEAQYLEEQGFLKMDFLGLRNLSIIYDCVDLINKNHPEAKLDKFHLPYDEEDVYKLISSGQTMGIFQLESPGMKRAIRILKPDCFDEIVKLLALFRPGPMDSIKSYALRKEGKEKYRFISEDLRSVLEPTCQIIVYQEQINDIARIMAGFSMADADLFRRAVSKKDKEKLESGRNAFVKGAIKNGYDEKLAINVFNHILKFAEYGFNKSHSVVYSIISCRMAWLKLHYPLEFYASILEIGGSGETVTVNDYIAEMKLRNYNIVSPDINISKKTFVIKDNNLIYPLTKIKGIGDQIVTKIMQERENGPFKDFFDFVTRTYSIKMTDAQMNKIIDSGSLDSLYPSRSTMLATYLAAKQYAELSYDENGQLSIGIQSMLPPAYNDQIDIPLDNLEREYDALGIMLSNNPLHYKSDLLRAKKVMPIIVVKEELEDEGGDYMSKTYTIAGILKTKKVISTKKSSQMAFIKVYDETSELEITIFPTLYTNIATILEKNNIFVIKGRFDKRDDEYTFIANEMSLLEE